jgi:hypothetical protein
MGTIDDLLTRKEHSMTEVRESSAGGSAGATDQAREKGQEVAGRAQEKGQEAAAHARARLRDQVDQRSTQAGQRTASTAGDVRSVARELRNQGKNGPARIADQVADRGERLGSYLERSDAERILQDVEDFGRRQPWAVMAGGLALGFLASRFLKASSRRRYETSHSPHTAPPPPRPIPSETFTGYEVTTPAGAAGVAPSASELPPPPLTSEPAPLASEPLPPTSPPPVPGARPEHEPGSRGTAGRP